MFLRRHGSRRAVNAAIRMGLKLYGSPYPRIDNSIRAPRLGFAPIFDKVEAMARIAGPSACSVWRYRLGVRT